MKCSCPLEDFPAVTDVSCKENFGQIQKIIFCDMRYINNPEYMDPYDNMDYIIASDLTTSSYLVKPTENDPDDFLEALSMELSKLLGMTGGHPLSIYINAAVVTVSPYVYAPTQEAGEYRTFGGGNDTPNGVERYLGIGPSSITGRFVGVPGLKIAKLKKMSCFAKAGYLGVIFVNQYGNYEILDTGKELPGKEGQSSVPVLWPIPVLSFYISDKIHGGYEEPDYYEFTLQLKPNYSDDLVIVPYQWHSGLDLKYNLPY